MKIYFAGSIRGGREDKELYLEIINILNQYGQVLTEHIGNQGLTDKGEVGLTDEFIYERDMKWLNESDVVVAEITTPSLGVGYEIGKMEGKKPVLCLYRAQDGKSVSVMIKGNKNVKVEQYQDLTEAKKIIQTFFTQTPF